MPVPGLDVAIGLGQVLKAGIIDSGVDADMPEREILCGRRLLDEKLALTVPEHRVGASPADGNLFPPASG